MSLWTWFLGGNLRPMLATFHPQSHSACKLGSWPGPCINEAAGQKPMPMTEPWLLFVGLCSATAGMHLPDPCMPCPQVTLYGANNAMCTTGGG